MAFKPLVPRMLLAALVAGTLALASCSGDSDAPATGQVTISHLARTAGAANPQGALRPAESALPPGVDSMQIKFEDANGALVYGPIEVPADPVVTIKNVPRNATTATVDYLRNGGYALATDDEAITWDGDNGAASPQPTAAGPSTTRWKAAMGADGIARLAVAVNGGSAQDFLIRGVAYSPAPIGYSNKDGPGFGDLFWDTPGGFLDFERVWKRDIETIRGHGFNAVRTYSMIANFIHYEGGRVPTQAELADPKNRSLYWREHKKFLDAAWNNGDRPVYVLVGIPMPSTIYYKNEFDNPALANNVAFWDNNFRETVTQMANHPAVIGFTILNEVGGPPQFFEDPELATHYWSQVQKYSEKAKSIAPDKLVGWAFFDNPPFAKFTIDYRSKYAKAIDFYGINTFQGKTLAPAIDLWLKDKQGSAARPILLTEFGLPATSRSAANDPLTIYEDATTRKKAADAVGNLIPEAFRHPVVAGMFYFEWSDEWWKQDPLLGVTTLRDRQEGGSADAGKPNGYWDEEGFGLHSIAVNDRPTDRPYSDNLGDSRAGNVQVDKLTPRTELLNAVVDAFKNAEQTRKSALNLK